MSKTRGYEYINCVYGTPFDGCAEVPAVVGSVTCNTYINDYDYDCYTMAIQWLGSFGNCDCSCLPPLASVDPTRVMGTDWIPAALSQDQLFSGHGWYDLATALADHRDLVHW